MQTIFDRNTLILLRIPFSFFLMPVYFFALSQSNDVVWWKAILIFFILHLFIYPASNGYNSYMDQDEGSIGGLKNPPKASRNMLYAALVLDGLGLALALTVHVVFFVCLLAYVLVSRAYSYKGIRLKKYPIIGFLSVVIFQGALVWYAVWMGCDPRWENHWFLFSSSNLLPMLAASLMLAGVYPLTQVYQHEQDKASGDITISLILGYRGTFVWSAASFALAGLVLGLYFPMNTFLLFQLFLAPVAVFFIWWFYKVWNDEKHANFENTMRMNLVASSAMNAFYCLLIFLKLV